MRGSISTLLFASVVSANVTIRMEGSGGPWEIEICESEFDKWIDVSNRCMSFPSLFPIFCLRISN